jgi:hypothetical protein
LIFDKCLPIITKIHMTKRVVTKKVAKSYGKMKGLRIPEELHTRIIRVKGQKMAETGVDISESAFYAEILQEGLKKFER